ncbi:hypothetical protein BJ878DRAFT_219336 [Calycina marina]|uniref:Uncharacterized protein n=1 Tax=Calycina marina TaxID=1763456 RepID=A0A9P8CC58_9HELO|nr:hypothetical protein BJ878DRAFT_219336 [Calycina marina]
MLYRLPELSVPGPVLLKGFHFSPFLSWMLFRYLIDPVDVVYANLFSMLPKWLAGKDSISFNHGVTTHQSRYQELVISYVSLGRIRSILLDGLMQLDVHGNDPEDY